MVLDNFRNYRQELNSPASDAAEITPGASPMANVSRGIYIGGAGNLSLITVAGTTVVFSSVPAGTVLTIMATHILATNTTATNIVSMW